MWPTSVWWPRTRNAGDRSGSPAGARRDGGRCGGDHAAASEPPNATRAGDSNIYRSDDDGVTWPTTAMPGVLNDWWQSLEVAPSNGSRVYLSGYRFVAGPSGNTKVFLLFRSDDAGASYQPLPVTDFTTMPNSTIEIAGVSHTDPNLVFARVKLADNAVSDTLYRSTDGGMTGTLILTKGSAISLVVRRSGDLVAATQAQGTVRSTDNGDTWTPIPTAPHINCLTRTAPARSGRARRTTAAWGRRPMASAP